MDSSDLEFLLDLIERKIRLSAPTTAAYWRGYCEGIKLYFRQGVEAAVRNLRAVPAGAGDGRADAFLEAYARGFDDGCRGMILRAG